MIETKHIFFMEDRIFKMPGLYLLWTCIYIANFVALIVDDTYGAVRTFNVLGNGLSVIYTGSAGFNAIYGNDTPSTLLVIPGPIHQYAFWVIFAYFRGDVFSNSPIGVMNYISCIIVGLFSVDMVFKTWYVTLNTKTYLKYVQDRKLELEGSSGVEESKSNA